MRSILFDKPKLMIGKAINNSGIAFKNWGDEYETSPL